MSESWGLWRGYDSVELPTDISGILFINYDEAGSWKYTMAKELSIKGFVIEVVPQLFI
jgi:predicted nucleotide-binding protein